MTDTNRKVWLITGASRGMGVEFVKTALKAGDRVVATARDVKSLKRNLIPILTCCLQNSM